MSRSRRDPAHLQALRDHGQGELFEGDARPRDPLGPALDRRTLLERIAADPARITVLTPNLRLAQALESEVDAIHLAERRSHWEAPDIIAFEPFLRRCHEEAVYSPAGAELSSLLSEQAAALVWEEAIRASRWRGSLLSVPAAASLAAQAWSLAHAWRIAGALRGEPGGEDAEAFARWAEAYERHTGREGLTDMARLPALVAPLLATGAIAKPSTLVLYAFDLVTPQQLDFLQACGKGGIAIARCEAPPRAAKLARIELESPRRELEHAARWARARLESSRGAARIAVVVPELAQRRREVARIFSRVLAPGACRPGEAAAPLFNLSLGEPLDAYALVDAALALLDLAAEAVPFERASRIVRSPFIALGERERDDRARLDAALRRISPAALNLTRLRLLIAQATRRAGTPACAALTRALDAAIEAARPADRAPAYEWARRFTRILDAAGFPGERTLDSVEYQTLEKWREALRELGALGAVAGHWSGGEARTRLRRLCAGTIFQPKSAAAPIQVLGLLESVGLEFDHLWVTGLTEESWPLSSRPHPLIPPALQRRAGIPQASPEEAFKVDERITRGWKGAAAEVVFSNARADGDRELLASPLIADTELASEEAIGIPDFPQLRALLFAAGRQAVGRTQDDIAPGVGTAAAQGGTGILVDQSACPFRAFARYRLDARALESPDHGLAPPERGTLLHVMMARLWERLGDQRTLAAMDREALARLVDEAATHAVDRVHDERPGRLEGRFRELERERLVQIATEWLQIEAARPPFEVVMREEKFRLSAGKLGIDGRVDRVDRLESGGLAVIDYKTGRPNVADWMGERPADAQLPLYALAVGEGDVRAVAFAKLRTGDRGFVGVAREEGLIPNVPTVQKLKLRGAKRPESWEALVAMWRAEVDKLGEGFAGGEARVDPREMLATCRRCDLKALCRVHERLSPLDEGDEEEAEEEAE